MEKQLLELLPGDYKAHWVCSTEKLGYAGVVVLTKAGIQPLKVEFGEWSAASCRPLARSGPCRGRHFPGKCNPLRE
jgi:hypothetical protein